MKKFSVFFLFALVAVLSLAAFQLQASPVHKAPEAGTTTAAVDMTPATCEMTPAAGGGCACTKPTPVCCRNCDGTFAFCARSYAYCPECPAP